MRTICSKRRVWVALAVFVATGLSGSGCSLSGRNVPVDAAKARDALRTALDSWKRGDTVDALQKSSPPIYIIDTEWQSGVILKDYQIRGDGQEMDAQLFCSVTIRVKPPNGPEVTRELTYIISTAPNVTVARKVQ
jgi:hypothetical protein